MFLLVQRHKGIPLLYALHTIKCDKHNLRQFNRVFTNNQQYKNGISVNTHLDDLKLQFSQNVEERNS